LVEIGAVVTAEDNLAVRMACEHGHSKVVDYLKTQGASLENAQAETKKDSSVKNMSLEDMVAEYKAECGLSQEEIQKSIYEPKEVGVRLSL
jgi:hypothetical protein